MADLDDIESEVSAYLHGRLTGGKKTDEFDPEAQHIVNLVTPHAQSEELEWLLAWIAEHKLATRTSIILHIEKRLTQIEDTDGEPPA